MTTSTNTYDLPNVEQRATATRLRQLLRDAEAQGPPPKSAAVESLHEQVPLLPSGALRDAVAKAFVALHREGLHGTLTRDLGAEGQRWRAVAGLALDELDGREARALQELAAHPPAYLVAAIGRPERPGLDPGAGQSPWLAVAGHIVAYRLQYGISDPTRALGARPSQTLGLAQETDWRFVLGEIRWSAGNLGERLADPRVLGVFDPTGVVIPQPALEALSGEPSALGRVDPTGGRRIRAAPSHWLRERVTGALGLLRQRPADCLAELEQLEAVRSATEVLYREELASRPPQPSAHERPRTLQEQRGEQLARRLHDLDAAIAGARRAWQQRAAWTTRHAEALAVGQLAAEELGLREHQALAALEEDPPPYLLAELGPPPAGTSGMKSWRHGVGLIERHRTRYEVGDPARAFGHGRDPAARDHEALTRRQVDLVRGALQLGADDRLALPEPPHRLLSGP
jgi:hypothetical protein